MLCLTPCWVLTAPKYIARFLTNNWYRSAKVEVTEQFLYSTSAQLGYTVPITLVHAGKYRTEDKSRTDKLGTTQKKQTKEKTAK